MNSLLSQSRITASEVQKAIINLRHVIFEVTDRCNLLCKYCIYGDNYEGYDSRLSRDMSFEDARAIIDYLLTVWRSNPTMAEKPKTTFDFYGGEPLLNFQLIQHIVNYVEAIDIMRTFKFSMTSNCLLLDRHMDYLVEKNFRLLCSLDGDDKANGYRVFRDGSPSFEKVYKNIVSLKEKYPDYFKNNVSFNVVLHNLNSIQNVYSFFEREFNKTPQLSEVSDVGFKPDLRESGLFSTDIHSESGEMESITMMDIKNFIKEDSGNFFSSYTDLLNEGSSVTEVTTGTCHPFGNKMFITVDGKILPCEQIPRAFEYGHVSKGVVSFNLNDVANQFNGYMEVVENSCIKCLKHQNCDQCFYQLQDMSKLVPKCKHFLTASKKKQLRESYIDFIIAHPDVYEKALI